MRTSPRTCRSSACSYGEIRTEAAQDLPVSEAAHALRLHLMSVRSPSAGTKVTRARLDPCSSQQLGTCSYIPSLCAEDDAPAW